MAWSPFLLLSLLQGLILSYAAPNPETIQSCNEISKSLPKKVKFPGQAAYWKENRDYYNIGLSELGPACIAFPTSAEDVSAIVKILNKIPNVQFAVKSGGHSPIPGHSSIEDGVLIALRNLVGTKLDREKKVAYVKPGGRWWDVYKALGNSGWTVVGGRLGTIGVGGFLLQGGVSFLSGEHGLAADNILEYEVVLANGTIANITPKSHPGIVEAMKGGGSQFGIATQFTLRSVPVEMMYVGFRLYRATREQFYEALQEFIANIGDHPKADTLLALGIPGIPYLPLFGKGKSAIGSGRTKQGGPDINKLILQLFAGYDLFDYKRAAQLSNLPGNAPVQSIYILPILYSGSAPPDAVFGEKFNSLPLVAKSGKLYNYNSVVSITDVLFRFWSFRTSFRTFTLPVQLHNPKFLVDLEDISKDVYTTYEKKLKGFGSVGVIVQPFPRSFGKAAERQGGNAMGLRGSDHNRIVLEIEAIYTNKADERTMLSWQKEYTDRVGRYMKDAIARAKASNVTIGEYNPFYMNDAGGDQDVLSTYRDVAKYAALQNELDPNGLWSKRSGGFKFPPQK